MGNSINKTVNIMGNFLNKIVNLMENFLNKTVNLMGNFLNKTVNFNVISVIASFKCDEKHKIFCYVNK
jgi:hypothetical protein